ncbi:FtsW/RodA/SpoVE family cell cycle protein [Gemella sp. zg-1178]|uniref:FtsW/RodA/SpoVE family cell cycle protein n=1 Tax=Gemella sp. zg-1178 TaxID=2840372 RepID=UPI001C05B4E0|nr:FtsW/RodA/SpoVE family cell cycle protein [Gemella sp. zg-1178]MBU0278279.1 FtsW/RodA/SpoVE family cell cycle protein [Gemella sp. zg-1178]
MNIKKILKRVAKEKRYKKLDIFVTLSLIILFVFSCIMVYSASMIGNKYGMFTGNVPVAANYFLIKQLIWATISLCAYLVFATIIPYEIFKNKNMYTSGFLFIIVLLIIPLFQASVNGAHSWINLAGFTFQPSTIAQIFIIAYMALILESRKRTLLRPTPLKKLASIFAVPLAVLVFIFLQNDTGTMLITVFVLVVMVLCANISFRNIYTIIKISILGAFGALFFLLIIVIFSSGSSYRVNRIKTFLDPFYGKSSSDSQVVNSLISFGNGGLFGRGLGNSIQKLGYLPEAHTDFILAITAEELGYFGVLFLVLLLSIIILKIIYTGLKAGKTFESLFALGFAALLFIQTIINMGGVSASLPLTGVPIPYFSFGGSSMFILSITLGIIMNLLSHIKYVRGSN